MQEYLPFTLAEHSSHASDPTKHILRSHEVENSLKKWDEDKLADWEWKVQGGGEWDGRKARGAGANEEKPAFDTSKTS